MKKVLAMILAVMLLVVAFAGCTAKDESKDVLTCGVTIFEKMNEKDANGNWTGFETEFAQAVGEIIGMEVEFQEIDWGQKYNELNSGAIDCVWNGFTANSSDDGVKRSDLVDFSYGYMLNQQCVVVKADNLDNFKSEADLAGKTACVEGGSAGASYAESVTDKDKIFSTPAQINAFTEVKSGAVDFIVVDILLAQNICGEADYADLAIVDAIELDSEIYAVGFKKGSELTAKVNAAIKELEANGKLMELAEKYGFENVLKVTETIE
ncbi:MAG: transporter substrate-binding domain-containing protein [Ruminococcaceae bacterium]|nr:transporter substrate-binding domain-containing protein [Oscillospiraceae bacterium]